MKPIIPRNVARIVFATGLLAMAIGFYTPVQGAASHAVELIGLAMLLVSAVFVNPKLAGGVFVFGFLILVVELWPVTTDPATLQKQAQDLRVADAALSYRFEGTHLLRGGMNMRGIDGTGIVRRGYVDSHLLMAVFAHNPGLARQALTVWFTGPTGTDLAAAYPDQIRVVSHVPALSAVPAGQIHLDDIASIDHGSMLLTNIAANVWMTIGTDPKGSLSTATAINIPPKNAVYAVPAVIYRWNDMDH